MQTLAEIRSRVDSTRDLSSIARTMKALSAVRIRQSREAVESLNRYLETVERGFQVLLRSSPWELPLPATPLAVVGEEGGGEVEEGAGRGGSGGGEGEPRDRVVAVVIGSDLGMVGRFNARVASYALSRLKAEAGESRMMAVGARAAAQMAAGGEEVALSLAMPDSVEAMAPRVRDMLVELNELRADYDPDRVLVFFNGYRSGAHYEPESFQLLPLDPTWLAELAREPWPTRVIPGFAAPVDELTSGLVREYLYISLFRAVAESHASENASRLAAMEAAESRIEERLEELTGRLRQTRNQKLTEELLDIIAGVSALEEDEDEDPERRHRPARRLGEP